MTLEVENIKDLELKELVSSGLKYASSTITNDLYDVLDSGSDEEELIMNWQSSLKNLKGEVDAYLNSLEKLKVKK